MHAQERACTAFLRSELGHSKTALGHLSNARLKMCPRLGRWGDPPALRSGRSLPVQGGAPNTWELTGPTCLTAESLCSEGVAGSSRPQ